MVNCFISMVFSYFRQCDSIWELLLLHRCLLPSNLHIKCDLQSKLEPFLLIFRMVNCLSLLWFNTPPIMCVSTIRVYLIVMSSELTPWLNGLRLDFEVKKHRVYSSNPVASSNIFCLSFIIL